MKKKKKICRLFTDILTKQYFAQCENPNETWLPLLEKAYAKAHGDYSAIEGGYGGEGIEDLTGGVTSEIYTTDILDKEYFWNEELMKVNQEFLFGCSTGVWGRGWGERKGIVELHAYSVLQAREIDGVRLVLLKNPWGKHEWKGPWSDGSKEWTAEWLQKLDHKFGDDGSFWISYDDLLKKYQAFDRTRLFGQEWKVVSIWTTLNVSWTLDYHETKFSLSLAKSGPVVLVFSQLDERYFKGLEGQYRFELSFRVHKAGEEDYVVRSQNYYRMNRSVNVELDLEAGEYAVVVKIDAQRNERIMPVEDVVRAHAKERREKLLRIGLAYDVAHSKGKIIETAEEKAARETYENKKLERDRKSMAKAMREAKQAQKKVALREKVKERRALDKARAKAKARAARRTARREARAKEIEEREKDEEKKKKKEEKEEDTETKPDDEELTGSGKEIQTKDTPAETEDNKPEDDKNNNTTNNSEDDTKQDVSEKPTSEDTGTQTTSTKEKEKHVKIRIPPVADTNTEGSVSSTEAGVATPASSTVFVRTPLSDDDAQEGEEDYVTAAEDGGEKKRTQSGEQQTPHKDEDGPPTPKAVIQPPLSTTKNNKSSSHTIGSTSISPERIDVGVQTGPGLPFPPPPLLPPSRRPPPPAYLSPMYLSHQPPPPGAHYARGPTRNHAGIPPPNHHHLRATYGSSSMPPPLPGSAPHLRREIRAADDAYSDTGLSSSESESDMDNVSEASDISDQDIDAWIAEARARASMRAAAAAVAKNQPGRPGTPIEEEVLDEFEKDPWNAVGVFGLRVYYKVPEVGGKVKADEEEEIVKLKVERPNPYLWEESEDEDEGHADDEREDGGDGAEETKVLDVDDSAKDAVGEEAVVAVVEEKKEEGKAEETCSENKEEVKEEVQGESEGSDKTGEVKRVDEPKVEVKTDEPKDNVKIEEEPKVEVKTEEI